MGAKEKFDRSLPHVNVTVIGHADHGKTTLTAALTRVCSEVFGSAVVEFDRIDAAPEETRNGLALQQAHVEYSSNVRHYMHTDAPTPGISKNLVADTAADGAVLVVSAPDGIQPMTRQHVLLARRTGIPYLVVFLNKTDLVSDTKQFERIESEVRNLLSANDYPGHHRLGPNGTGGQGRQGDGHQRGQEAGGDPGHLPP
ncbi:hypothetical protein GCM10010361_11260 [Streptomyces olivaceiscleroticus]|uniref:Tr-type G domain-containing protein n=1 Tax=Streptomyces olivaceiscleroticus TaxID=68245 RepID=A0ABN0ZJ23_9ACTN